MPKRRRSKSIVGNPAWCSICGLRIPDNTVDPHDDLYGTIDHRVPLSRGGEDDSYNRVPAHRKCNSFKRDRIGVLPGEILQLQIAVARTLNTRGIPTGPVQVWEAKRRINLVPPIGARLRGAPYMIAVWEDDGGTVAQY